MNTNIKNLYSVSKDIQVVSNMPSFIPPGIHENIRLIDVKYEMSDKGNWYLAFYFENEQGDKLSHTEFPVNPIKAFEELTQEEKISFFLKVENQRKRIGQIVTAFIPKEQYDFESDSFEDFAKNIIKLLTPSLNVVKVRVKVIYNNKNFTTLPNYWKHQFIENMSVPSEKSKIKILNIDVEHMERTKANFVSKVEVNDVLDVDEKMSTEEVNDNNLPF
jgi:hypothetical protein